MAEYIEREAAINALWKLRSSYRHAKEMCVVGGCVLELKECVPTADVVEVRHGTWLDKPIDGKPVPFDEHYNDGCVPQYSCFCSVCGEWLTASDEYAVFGRYCPNCGAKMDGKGEDNGLRKRDDI